jgi:hypothetical protein
MKVKTSILNGAALDWAVCVCEDESPSGYTRYSTDWAQGGPIIQQKRIDVVYVGFERPDDKQWVAMDKSYGPTPLVAAMRCYVASCLGDEVDIPENLL